MCWETWLSLATCLTGVLALIFGFGKGIADLPIFVLFLIFVPFVIVAGTSFILRNDQWASRVQLVVSILVTIIGVVGWLWASVNGPWGLVLWVMLLIPPVQFLVWFGGAIISGRRGTNQTYKL